LVRVSSTSLDPYLSTYANATHPQKQEVGSIMGGLGVGVVTDSDHKDFKAGDVVMGKFGWQNVAVSDGTKVTKITHKLKASYSLGVLGLQGVIAYLGFYEVLNPKEGEVVFITGSGSAVGSLVGQLAKMSGARVIGTVNGADKIDSTKPYGYDHLIDFKGKEQKDLSTEIKTLVPDGIDCFFENTGHYSVYISETEWKLLDTEKAKSRKVSDAIWENLKSTARVSVCGLVSTYGREAEGKGPSILIPYTTDQKFTTKGYTQESWTEEQKQEAFTKLHGLVESGKLNVIENITKGLDNAAKAFLDLYTTGYSLGKAIVEL